MFNEYPYTDYHELNTDWIIGKIKNVETAEANTKQYAEDADAAKVAAEDAKDIAVQAKDDAVQAKDDAVSAKNDAQTIVNNTQQQIDLLQVRVDNIIPDGTQTAGNTELLDVRVGWNGVTYTSAGDAVRYQAAQVDNALDQVSAGLSESLFDDTAVSVYGLGVAGFVGLGSRTVSIGTDYIQTASSGTMITRELRAKRSGTIYFGSDVLTATYAALAVGKPPYTDWYDSGSNKRIDVLNPVRYRLSDGNMPDISNPLYVNAGDILVLTLPTGMGSLYVYGSLFNNNINSNIILPSDLKTKKITKTAADNYDIQIGSYTFHYKETTTGVYTRWNILGVDLDSDTIVTNATDIIGPIRESNGTYIGGVHGYENTDSMTIYVDGAAASMNVNDVLPFTTLDIVHESTLTSTVTSTQAWERLYHLAFSDTGLKIDNNYKCIDDGQVITRATNGGIWGSPNPYINAMIATNEYFASAPTSESTETYYLADETDECAFLYTAGHKVTMKNTRGHDTASYKAIYTIYGTETPKRTKVYFLTLDSSTTFNTDDVIFGGFELLLD